MQYLKFVIKFELNIVKLIMNYSEKLLESIFFLLLLYTCYLNHTKYTKQKAILFF